MLFESIFGFVYETICDKYEHTVGYIVDKNYYKNSLINFVCGYSNKPEHKLKAKLKKINILLSGKNTDLKINKPVYDIEFELIKENEQ